MKKDLLHTPEGVRDIYGKECSRKLVLCDRLMKVCKRFGYNNIQTPLLEYFDVFSKERGSVSANEMFKLFDRYGNTLVLRPDMTPAIARTAAKYYEDTKLPVKLCYEGNTYINVSKYYQGKLKENTSIGAELIGDDSLGADYEIISMVIECMKTAGLKEFQVEVGNSMFFKGLLDEAGISGDAEEELISHILEKNYIGVEEVLNSLNIDKYIAKVLLELPQLFGSVEVLEKAKELTNNEMCLAAIKRLEDLYEMCKLTGVHEYITFDLGNISNHAYYTGIVFNAYTFGTGVAVMNGGRYDKLLGQFGCDKASIGFSITVDSLMAAIARQNIDIPVEKEGILVVYNSTKLMEAVTMTDSLRKEGNDACMIEYSPEISAEQYSAYASECGLNEVVFIQCGGEE